MHDIDLILTLTGGVVAALLCGYVTFRLGLSPIVGYLIAGFVANQDMADLASALVPPRRVA
jgi:monovalent cation:H+ antiporter-2, CPA2 family